MKRVINQHKSQYEKSYKPVKKKPINQIYSILAKSTTSKQKSSSRIRTSIALKDTKFLQF